jgi:pimeloyl-ACP methyl ester carboxylesterase
MDISKYLFFVPKRDDQSLEYFKEDNEGILKYSTGSPMSPSSGHHIQNSEHRPKIPYFHIQPEFPPSPDNPSSPYVFILFHGTGQDIFEMGGLAAAISNYFGASVIVPEYRGYGLLAKVDIDAAETREDMCCLLWELSHSHSIKYSNMIALGISLGSHFASYVASIFPLRACVILSGFYNMQDVIQNRVGTILNLFVSSKLSNESAFKQSKSPTLILHGAADDLVPCSHALSISSILPTFHEVIIYPGVNHADFSLNEQILQPIASFLSTLKHHHNSRLDQPISLQPDHPPQIIQVKSNAPRNYRGSVTFKDK